MQKHRYSLPRSYGKHRFEIGEKAGRWTIVGDAISVRGARCWQTAYPCRCDCGTERIVRADRLRGGESLSCGCLRHDALVEHNTRHDESRSRLYKIRISMIQRCHNPKCYRFSYYGSRGICVCREWRESYESFRDWSLANGYSDELEIDRIDNDRGYEPANCRWVTKSINVANRRPRKPIAAFGETKGVVAWSRDPRCTVTLSALRRRLARGIPPEKAIAGHASKRNKREPAWRFF